MTMIPAFLLQQDAFPTAATGGLLAMSGLFMLLMMAFAVVSIIGFWKMFEKAGQPGWAAIVPIYNMVVMMKIIGRPTWWVLLMLIPFVNFVVYLLVTIDVAKSFGQSPVFGIVALFLLCGIGYLMLGFGNYRYLGPANVIAP